MLIEKKTQAWGILHTSYTKEPRCPEIIKHPRKHHNSSHRQDPPEMGPGEPPQQRPHRQIEYLADES